MSLKRTIKRIFFPEVCKNCGEIIPIHLERCSCGFSDVDRISKNFCEHCAAEKEYCSCFYSGSAFLPHITAPFVYSGAIKERIHDLKFNHNAEEAKFFAHEMSVRFAVAYPFVNPDYVTFVPMTEAKINERGYNQSELLASLICEELSFCEAELLFKTKDTLNQHNLSKAERLSNLNGAFEINSAYNLKGKTVLICDDVKTTGTTLKNCCDLLFSAGAEDVYCICCAVTGFFVPISHVLRNNGKYM